MKYAVIHTESIFHEGDERSRTNPGHGYPTYTEKVEKITRFPSQEALKEWILQQDKYKKFTAIEYQELEVKTEIKIDFKRPVGLRTS